MEAHVIQEETTGTYDITFTNAQRWQEDPSAAYYLESSSEFITQKLVAYSDGLDERISPYMRASQDVGFSNFPLMMTLINTVWQRSEDGWPRLRRIPQLYHAGSMDFLANELKHYIGNNPQLPLFNELDFFRAIHWILLRFWEPFVIGEPPLIEQALGISKAISGYSAKQITEITTHFLAVLPDLDQEISERMAQFMHVANTLVPAYTLQFYSDVEANGHDILDKYGLSTARFEEVKGLYQDLFETIFRLSPLMVAHNNIIHRGSIDAMSEGFGRTTTIAQFTELRTGNKVDKLTNPKKPRETLDYLIELPVSTALRNAIGHARWSYDPVSQLVTYDRGKSFLLEFALEVPHLLRAMLGLWELVYKTREWDYVSHGVLPSLDFSRLMTPSVLRNRGTDQQRKSKKSIEKRNRKQSRRKR